MSMRSWPEVREDRDLAMVEQDVGCARSEYGISGTSKVDLLGKGRRLKYDSKRRDLDGDKTEKKRALYLSRTGYISSLTRIRKEVEVLIESGKRTDVEKKLASYKLVWRNFVDTHDKYMHLLDNGFERDLAYDVYEVQMHKSIEFDAMVKSWGNEFNEEKKVDLVSRGNTCSVKSKLSSCSSKLSTLSKKKEKLAHAQLKVQQVAKQHEIAKKMLELKNESEMLEVQMKREEAMVSLNILEEQSVGGQSLTNLFHPESESKESKDEKLSIGLGQNLAQELSQFNPAVGAPAFSNVNPKPSKPAISITKLDTLVSSESGLPKPVASAKTGTVPESVHKIGRAHV